VQIELTHSLSSTRTTHNLTWYCEPHHTQAVNLW